MRTPASTYNTVNTFIAPAQPRTHELKTWPACFVALEAGNKTFDVRENDRNYRVGDALLLLEYEPEDQQYTGRSIMRWISHILQGGAFGVEAGWCVLGLSALPPLPPGVHDTKLW
ncbi:hypothetical protein GCM10023185_16420 [Hymenobacter saemangeumensis]|uniref:DUF3850 domain-containing protein n=1 Tax=Hymenobacter saemangeumensis TaxID=1084522 RepID=A0ABP8IA97_9BACT